MGLFDNFIKQIDNSLKAVENGALEERLNEAADKIDATTKKVEKTLGNAADKPQQVLKVAEQKKNQFEAKVHDVQQRVGKSIDVLYKKD